MKTFLKLSLMGTMAFSSFGLIGCDETMSKTESTKTASDGSMKTETEKTVKEADGTMKKETSMEKTPPTKP